MKQAVLVKNQVEQQKLIKVKIHSLKYEINKLHVQLHSFDFNYDVIKQKR